MPTRTPLLRQLLAGLAGSSLALALATLAACGDPAHTDDVHAGDSTLAAKSARRTADSIAAHRSDSTMLAPLPPLAPAEPAFAADSIPLHAPNGEPTRYGLKSGVIVQRFTGNSRGERRTTFDDYGMRERREEKTRPYPEGTKGGLNNLITITTPEEMAYADVRTRRGWRTPNEGLKRYMAMGASKTTSLGEMIMAQSGARRLPDTTIAGYHCRVLQKDVKGMTVTDWIWRGIVLREHLVSPQDSVDVMLEPVEIIPNAPVPAGTFSFPPGYKIEIYAPDSTKRK